MAQVKNPWHLFTPRSLDGEKRFAWHISDEDLAKTRRGRWTAIITNLEDGKRYKVRGAACSLPRCYCDAVVLSEV